MSAAGGPGQEPGKWSVPTGRSKRPWWGIPVVVLAVIAIGVLAAVGISGLTKNPVGATHNGVTTITGNFEPFDDCGHGCVDGYVGAGGRDVFVKFPHGCPQPVRDGLVVVHGRLDKALGNATYLSQGCALPQP